MATTHQNSLVRALLEQAAFNTHLTTLISELMQKAGIVDDSPEVKLLELIQEKNNGFIQHIAEAVNRIEKESNG